MPRPRLPPERVWPLRRSEVGGVLPGFAHVEWSRPWGPSGPAPRDLGWLARAEWWAGPGGRDRPAWRVTLYPVPSGLVDTVGAAMVDLVAPALRSWLAEAGSSEAWRAMRASG